MPTITEDIDLSGGLRAIGALFSQLGVLISDGATMAPGVYALASDPGATGRAAAVGSLLLRTDVPSLYSKTGPNAIDWTLIAGGAVAVKLAQLALTGKITPGAIGGTKNDYSPPSIRSCDVIRQAVAVGGAVLTGLDAVTQQLDGCVIVMQNVGPDLLTLAHEDSGSLAANRFNLPGDEPCTIPVDGSATLQYDGTSSRWRVTSLTPAPQTDYFGLGLDGALNFDGASAVLGVAPVAGVYTMTRDVFATTATIAAGVTVNMDGYRLFASSGIIAPAAGLATIADVAANGGNGGAGVAGVGATGRGNATSRVLGGGSNGGPGGGGNAFGSAGQTLSQGCPAFVGGTGGVGGSPNAGGAGGGGGTQPAPTAQVASNGSLLNITQLISGRGLDGTRYTGGTGGSGGGGNTAGASGGGGGGAGGGIILVCARSVTNPANLVIAADGGNGGNGNGGGPSGGGGGGGGGYSILVLGSGVAPTLRANGGTGGNAGGGGGATNGANGSAGRTFVQRTS